MKKYVQSDDRIGMNDDRRFNKAEKRIMEIRDEIKSLVNMDDEDDVYATSPSWFVDVRVPEIRELLDEAESLYDEVYE